MEDFPLLIIDPPQGPEVGEYREKQLRDKTESFSRYQDLLTNHFATEFPGVGDPAAFAESAMNALFVHWRQQNDDECICSCHPRLPASNLHDFGFDCSCTWDTEKREQKNRERKESLERFWASPDYQAFLKKVEAEEAELDEWLTKHPEIQVTSHGGWAPEQWKGDIDGHSFYFRERHDYWHIEIDLQPTGQFFKTFAGADANGEPIYGEEPITEGEVIAEGSVNSPGYGNTPVERIEFIASTIRNYLSENQRKERKL